MAIGSFNKAIIGGRLGRDPEFTAFEDGNRIARLSIATTEEWTRAGERQEKTDWHRVVLFKKAAVSFAENGSRTLNYKRVGASGTGDVTLNAATGTAKTF